MRCAAQCGRPARRGISNARLSQARDQLVRAQKDGAAALAQQNGWHGTAEELRQSGRSPGRDSGSIRKPVPGFITTPADALRAGYQAKRNRSASARAACTPWRFSRTCPAKKPFLQLAGEETMVGGWCRLHGLTVRRTATNSRLFWLNSHRPAHSPRHTRRACKHADALADRLRREADRVARKVELEATLNRHQGQLRGTRPSTRTAR